VKKRYLGILTALVSVGLVVGVFAAVPASADPPNMNPSGGISYIRGVGSDTTYEMMVALGDQYNNAAGCITSQSGQTFPLNGTCVNFGNTNPPTYQYQNGINNANPDHDVVWNMYPVGSGNGITLLSQTGNPGVIPRLSYARSSRTPSASDAAGLRFLAYARDAVPWIKYDDSAVANEASDPVTNLTQAQIQSIFVSCASTDWNQVGGNAGPIIVWAAQGGSGTRATYDGFVGGNSTSCIPAAQKDGNLANGERVNFENTSVPIFNSTANDCTPLGAGCTGNSIFYYSLGRFNENPPVDGTKSGILGSINGVAPTEPNVVSGAYLYSRNVFNVIRNAFASGNANQSVRDFFDGDGWLCAHDLPTNPTTGVPYRTEVEDLIHAKGFFPLPVGAQGGGFPNGHCRITDT
jgi:ABC-type phosphate transport system substrate-binding protein